MIESNNRRRSCTRACACTRTSTPAAARRGSSRRSHGSAPIRCPPIRLTQTVAACARHVGVHPERVVLVNGLEEGILAIAAPVFARRPTARRRRSIIPQPAFEVFEFYASTVGARGVTVMPGRDFAFPLDDVLAAISARTRVVILTNPNNPTGIPVPLPAIRTIATAPAARRHRVRGRGVHRLRRRDLRSRAAALSQRHRRPHLFQGLRARRTADRAADR